MMRTMGYEWRGPATAGAHRKALVAGRLCRVGQPSRTSRTVVTVNAAVTVPTVVTVGTGEPGATNKPGTAGSLSAAVTRT